MELLASVKQRQFEENVRVARRCYRNYIKQLILGNRHFKTSILAKGVELFSSRCVQRIIVDLPCGGDGFKDPMRTHL